MWGGWGAVHIAQDTEVHEVADEDVAGLSLLIERRLQHEDVLIRSA